jgi:shikimate kinase
LLLAGKNAMDVKTVLPGGANIYLIGYRCTGKSSVGRLLADRLGLHFIDTDELIVKRTGVSIAGYVAQNGWMAFRRQETAVLVETADTSGRVVATGGGIVLDPGNVALMKRTGRVVWLRAGSQTIRNRMAADGGSTVNRPSLTRQGSLAEIEAVLAEREPLYAAAADMVLDTDGKDAAVVAAELLATSA